MPPGLQIWTTELLTTGVTKPHFSAFRGSSSFLARRESGHNLGQAWARGQAVAPTSVGYANIKVRTSQTSRSHTSSGDQEERKAAIADIAAVPGLKIARRNRP